MTNTLVKPYEVISQFDPAVDRDAPEFEHKWEMYLDGKDEPPLKPGAKAAVFRLRHLGELERKVLRKYASGGEVTEEFLDAAAALALVGYVRADGKEVRLKFGTERYALFETPHVNEESIREMDLAQNVLSDIGSVVLRRTYLRPS
jgi:hypothetical protein